MLESIRPLLKWTKSVDKKKGRTFVRPFFVSVMKLLKPGTSPLDR